MYPTTFSPAGKERDVLELQTGGLVMVYVEHSRITDQLVTFCSPS